MIHNLSNILQRVYEKGVNGRLRLKVLRYLAECNEGEPNTLSSISKKVRASSPNVIPVIRWLSQNGFINTVENVKSDNRVSRTYDITAKGIVFVLGFLECEQEKILRKYTNYMPFIDEAKFIPEERRKEMIKSINIITFLTVDFSDKKSVRYTWPSVVTTIYNAYMPFIMQRMEQKSEPIVLTDRYRKSACDVADRFEMHAKILRKFAKCKS